MTSADRTYLVELRARLARDMERLASIASSIKDDEMRRHIGIIYGDLANADWYARFVLCDVPTVYATAVPTLAGKLFIEGAAG